MITEVKVQWRSKRKRTAFETELYHVDAACNKEAEEKVREVAEGSLMAINFDLVGCTVA